jgi:hypothetical protein
MSNTAEGFEIEVQGDHEYVVRLHSHGDVVESWFRLTPSVLEDVSAGHGDEERVVRRTVEFLLERQDVEDFPDLVELEDVIASYTDYLAAMTA